jgi:hypothetical protein
MAASGADDTSASGSGIGRRFGTRRQCTSDKTVAQRRATAKIDVGRELDYFDGGDAHVHIAAKTPTVVVTKGSEFMLRTKGSESMVVHDLKHWVSRV